MTEVTAEAGRILYPSMEPVPNTWQHTPLERLYSNSPDLFRAPPPPAPLPREAVMYDNSPAMHEPALRDHQEHWARQAAGIDPGARAAAARGLAALPAEVRGTLVGAGMDQHPAVVGWLKGLRR